MKVGAGIFWLLVLVLFGGAAYFGVHVHRMMEAASHGHGRAHEGAPEGEGAEPGAQGGAATAGEAEGQGVER